MEIFKKRIARKVFGIFMTTTLIMQSFVVGGINATPPTSSDMESYQQVESFPGKDGDITVTRTINKLVNEKNTWDVEMKVVGNASKVNESTEVVLVLDRSESMKKINADGEMRGDLVRDAAIELTDSLLQEDNMNVSVVSFGAFNPALDGDVPSIGIPAFNDAWGDIYLKSISNWYGIWPEYTVETDFTSDKNIVQNAIRNCMTETNYYGGTPTAMGIVKAGRMLLAGNASNKVIVLVSDGPPSYKRNGEGPAVVDESKPSKWDVWTNNDITFASTQAHQKINNLQFFTIAVGDDLHKKGAQLISDCATKGDGYAHKAADTAYSLTNIMGEIGTNIKKHIGGETILKEVVHPYISIQSPTENFMDSVVNLRSNNKVDWTKTSAALSQGTIDSASSTSIEWNLGELKAGTPAIMRYRITLEDANIGEKRWISSEGKLQFKNRDNYLVAEDLPNLQIGLDWAKIVMQTGYSDTERIIPNTETIVWYKIPKSSTTPMNFGYNTRYNEHNLEVDNSSQLTIRNVLKLPIDIEINEETVSKVIINNEHRDYDIMNTNSMKITQSPNKVVTLLKRVQSADIVRTVTEVEEEKNVWEVELKVTGTTSAGNVPTDVVLVLDRSGSMAIRNRENKKRGENVLEAAKNLADTLLEQPNINMAAVSFGGFKPGERAEHEPTGSDGEIPPEGLPYFDANWNTIMLSPQNKPYGEWAQCTIDSGFTDDPKVLKEGLDIGMHWNNLYGGTPISLGIVQAGKMLQESSGTNKVIILLSDGMPSYSRDGKGPGVFDEQNPATWDWNSINDTIKVSEEAHEKISGLKMFTIAAGNSIPEKGKEILKDCATTDEYVYSAEDTLDSLNQTMESISQIIIGEIATEPIVEERLLHNLTIESPTSNISESIKTVDIIDEIEGTTQDIDWNTTSLAITQGEVEQVNKNSFTWSVGKVSPMHPAIIKYRINMKEGDIGHTYEISTHSDMSYVGEDSILVTKDVPNAEVNLSWVELDLSTYDYQTEGSIKDSQITLWYKVPEDFMPGDMKFNYSLKYNEHSNEIDTEGNKTVATTIKLPTGEDGTPAIIKGVLVDDIMYTEKQTSGIDGNEGAVLVHTPTKIVSLLSEPEISSESNSTNNFIQPEGVSNIAATIEFGTISKDVKYIVDISNIVNETLNNNILMNYNTSLKNVQVRNINQGNRLLTQNVDYDVAQYGNNIEISLRNKVNEGDKFKVDIYIPSTFTKDVVYGGNSGNTGSTYINTFKNKFVKVDNIIMATPKINEIVDEDGTVKEVYGGTMIIDSKDRVENKISLKYIDIAAIH